MNISQDRQSAGSKKTRVLIVDDHMIVVEGIKRFLSEQPEFEVVGTASDGLEAVKKVKTLKPDKFDDLVDVLNTTAKYWLENVEPACYDPLDRQKGKKPSQPPKPEVFQIEKQGH